MKFIFLKIILYLTNNKEVLMINAHSNKTNEHRLGETSCIRYLLINFASAN